MIHSSPFRIGIVSAQDVITGRARVFFPDRDNMQSYWLFILVHKTHLDKGWWMPDIGDQVACLMDDNDEDGAIAGAIYSTVDPTPGWTAPSALKRTSDNSGTLSTTPLTGTLDQMFQAAAATCPGIQNYGHPSGQGWKLLKALAITESSLNTTNAMSEPGADGSRSYGLMQISSAAHPGYSPTQLMTNTDLNLRLGTADLCGKLAKFGGFNDALAHYKGYNGYSDPAYNGHAAIRVNAVYSEYTKLGGT